MKIDKKYFDKLKTLLAARKKKTSGAKGKKSGSSPQMSKLKIRIIIFAIAGAAVYGGMKYFETSKPVIAVAKVKKETAKKTKKTKDPNSVKEKKNIKKENNEDVNNLQSQKIEQVITQAGEGENDNDVNNVIIAEEKSNGTFADFFKFLMNISRASLSQAGYNDINDVNTPFISQSKPGEIQSLVFMKNMEIRDAMHFLAAKYRKNIVPTPEVQGQLAFENLYEVTFTEAMDAILGTEFRYEYEGNLVKVYPAEKGQMEHKVFFLYFINAEEAKKLVSQVLSKDGKIEVTSASQVGVPVSGAISSMSGGGDSTAMNDTLIVCDYSEYIKKAEDVINSIDVRPEQVMIEATILSAALTEGMQFGIDWQTLKNVAIQELADLTYDSPDYIKSAGTSARIGSAALAGGLTVGFVHDDVSGFLRAVEEITDVTVLANPKILAVNKQLGQIYIGKKVAYQSQTTQTDTSTTEQVQFLETGTKLSFRPYISRDGYIRIDIHPKDSSATLRSSGTSTLPDETSAELVTNIIVKDGHTIVIGGLFRQGITTTRTQIPILGSIPIIGKLFRGTADEAIREEVIVLLTPHIITDPNQADGQASMTDVQRKIIGARDELQWINNVRRANEYYDKAAEQYLQGEHSAALKNLNAALKLYPAYLEAIRLKDLITREISLKRLKTNIGN